jgi:hypothetical protein
MCLAQTEIDAELCILSRVQASLFALVCTISIEIYAHCDYIGQTYMNVSPSISCPRPGAVMSISQNMIMSRV